MAAPIRFYLDENVPVAVAAQLRRRGVVFGQQHKHSIGDGVRFLELLASVIDAEEMHNRIEFVG